MIDTIRKYSVSVIAALVMSLPFYFLTLVYELGHRDGVEEGMQVQEQLDFIRSASSCDDLTKGLYR